MNKKIIMGICIVLVIAVAISIIVVSLKNEPDIEEINRDETLYNGGNVAEEGMEPINKDIVLGDILNQVKQKEEKKLTGITDEEANELLDLKEYAGLEKKVAKYENEEEYTEIWLFKISEQNQATNIFRMFNERIIKLREKYSSNEKISEILNNEKNIIMKQQQGIAIVIISDNATEVEKSLDLEFVK